MAKQYRIFIKYINATAIDAHLGWMGNDLDRLEKHFDTYPKVVSEIEAMLAEQRKQPKRAHQFFLLSRSNPFWQRCLQNV